MLQLTGITKEFGAVKAVDNVSLNVEAGSRIVILGPSGCGKTTLLRLIAGFERPDRGDIVINGNRFSRNGKTIPLHKRKTGMIFQDLALWPHMTILKHILFCSNTGKKQRQEKALETLSLVGLEKHSHKYPHQLSGGEKQRLALGRALATVPRLLLFDEPLSSLDPLLKSDLLEVIIEIQERFKTTMVYVTHDQQEACAFSDSGVVMCAGRIVQTGTWKEIIKSPSNEFVEMFMKGVADEVAK